MSEIRGVERRDELVSRTRGRDVDEATPAVPLSASETAGALETRVAGMMGALLTTLSEVTGGRPVTNAPMPPPIDGMVAGGIRGEPGRAAFGALQTASASLREMAAKGDCGPTQREALEEAASVVEEFAELRREAVFRTSR